MVNPGPPVAWPIPFSFSFRFWVPGMTMHECGPRHCHFFNVLKSGGCLMNQFANDWDNDSYLGSMDRLVSQKQLDDHYSVWHFLLKLTRGKHNANHQVSTWLGPRSTLDLGTRFEPWVPEFLLFLDDHFIFLNIHQKAVYSSPDPFRKPLTSFSPRGCHGTWLPWLPSRLCPATAVTAHCWGWVKWPKSFSAFCPSMSLGADFFFGKERMGSENVLDIV